MVDLKGRDTGRDLNACCPCINWINREDLEDFSKRRYMQDAL